MTREQRKHSREEAMLSVDYTLDIDGVNFFYVASDISREGVFIKTPKPAPCGTRLMVTFNLSTTDTLFDNNENISVPGIVAHTHNAGTDAGMGIHLEGLSDRDWQRLDSFLQRKREALSAEVIDGGIMTKQLARKRIDSEMVNIRLRRDLEDYGHKFSEKD